MTVVAIIGDVRFDNTSFDTWSQCSLPHQFLRFKKKYVFIEIHAAVSFCFDLNMVWPQSVLCVCVLIKMEDAPFPGVGNTTGVNSASSKTDTGRGNGPLPLGGSGLMEEMSALLARRRRIAEKGSTIEAEQKEDKNVS